MRVMAPSLMHTFIPGNIDCTDVADTFPPTRAMAVKLLFVKHWFHPLVQKVSSGRYLWHSAVTAMHT